MIYFLCDGKACETCSGQSSDCMLTSNINHAVNFKKNELGDYLEIPALLEAEDSFADLVKALNDLTITWIERIPKVCQASKDVNEQRVVKIQKALECAIYAISKKIECEALPTECTQVKIKGVE